MRTSSSSTAPRACSSSGRARRRAASSRSTGAHAGRQSSERNVDREHAATIANEGDSWATRVRELAQRDDLNPRWDELCERLLEREPEDRYSSAAELAEDLVDLLREEEEAGAHEVQLVLQASRGADFAQKRELLRVLTLRTHPDKGARGGQRSRPLSLSQIRFLFLRGCIPLPQSHFHRRHFHRRTLSSEASFVGGHFRWRRLSSEDTFVGE